MNYYINKQKINKQVEMREWKNGENVEKVIFFIPYPNCKLYFYWTRAKDGNHRD